MALKKQNLIDMFEFNSRGLSSKVKSQILLVTGRGGVSSAKDYTSANCLLSEVLKQNPDVDLTKINDAKELWGMLHPSVRFRLQSYTPMLALQYDALKENEQKQLFNDSNWVFTEKQNGCRGWVIINNGDMHIFSRNYSDKDCGLLEYSKNIDQQTTMKEGIYAVDVEIKFEPGVDIRPDLERLGLTTDSPLEAMVALLHTYPEEAVKIQRRFKETHGKDLVVFRLIAPLYFQGKNYLKRTLGEGQDVYEECIEFGKSIGLNIEPIQRCSGTKEEKEIFLNSILNNGGEGVVCHNRRSPYVTSNNRSKTGFIKIKRSVSSTMNGVGMGDTIDGWISGFKVGSNGTANEGIISSFEVSCYVQSNGTMKEHVIAVVPNIEKTLKDFATIEGPDGMCPTEVTLSDGTTKWISLNPDVYGSVVEVDGQSISNVSMRMTHPRLLRFRPEKDQNACIYLKEFLESQMDKNLK